MKRNKKKTFNFQNMVFAVFLFCFAILFLMMSYLSLSPSVYGINMDEFAANRNTYKTELEASRGTIYDSENNILAQNMSSYTVIAYLSDTRTGSSSTPKHVIDKEGTAKALAPIINMSEEDILALLNREVYQVELGPGGRGISELVKAEIEALNLPGIDFIESYIRKYPNGDFASYIIGYAKTDDEDEITGELGIESIYDDLLKGTDGYLEYQRDRFGYKIPDTDETRVEAVDGADIYLTIDANIQRFLETTVKETAETSASEWMQIAVMDAKTGEILGSSTSPSFDPNIRDITNYENPLISFVYEPGSVMKTYTYMCAIEAGVYDGSYTFLSGSIDIYDDTISDWNGKGFGTITLDKGFEYSSNVAIAKIMDEMLSKEQLRECLEDYGFGEQTGIDLPRELSGVINFTYPIEVAAAGYGQGITTTAIQQMQALTILANDGHMITPSVVDKIVDPNTGEIIFQNEIEISEKLVKDSTVAQVNQLLYNTVNNTDSWTTGKYYAIDGYDIIGKTGTAQIFDPSTGKYMSGANDHIYSFAGMFPAEDPEIIIYAAMKRPANGASSLSPAVKEVIENIATYTNMYKEQTEAEALPIVTLESYTSKSMLEVKTVLENNGINVTVIGDGDKIIDQYPTVNTQVLKGDRVILITNGQTISMPNIVGWSKNDATTLLDMLKLDYTIDGFGYVESQSILPNTLIVENMKVTVTLKDKYGIN